MEMALVIRGLTPKYEFVKTYYQTTSFGRNEMRGAGLWDEMKVVLENVVVKFIFEKNEVHMQCMDDNGTVPVILQLERGGRPVKFSVGGYPFEATVK